MKEIPEVMERMGSIFQTLVCLEESTDNSLFLWDLKESQIYFIGDIIKRFDLPHKECYSFGDLEDKIYSLDLRKVLEEVDAIYRKEKYQLNLEFRAMDVNGNFVWIKLKGKMIQENILVGELSEDVMTRQVDIVTGCLNNDKLYEHLDRVINIEYGYLIVFGMDDFKTINSNFGRAYGNQMLNRVARVIEECVGSAYNVYRLDGDCYATILTNCKKNQVEEYFKKIQNKMPANCTLSAGAASFPSPIRLDSNLLHQYAEIALDNAKKEGRNRLVFFSESDYTQHLYTIELTEELRSSLNNDFQGFEIYYQPQIAMQSNKVCGAEALLRFHSYDKGMISPNQFIPILEQSGMIIAVGKWVIHECIRICKIWRKQNPDFIISINLSYLQLKDENFADFILRELNENHLPGRAIVLELTESIQLQDYAEYNQLFYELGKYGIRISIDDFGTGYSSLSYLKSLSVDEIKIDRCFVSQIQSSAYNYRLLSNIIELAKSTNIQVCCEGVEQEEELSVLLKLRPEKLQGYLFGRPIPQKQFEKEYLNQHLTVKEKLSISKKEQINLQSMDYERLEREKNTIINYLEEMVYVSDLETYELYYLNPSGQRLTGVYDYQGQKCYKVLHGLKEPCEYCMNHLLREHVYFDWIDHNDYLDCSLKMKKKMIPWFGTQAHLGVGIKLSEENLQNLRDDIGESANDLLVKAISLYHSSDDFYQGLDKMLAFIGDYCKAERSYVFLHNPKSNHWKTFYNWSISDKESIGFKMPVIDHQLLEKWLPIMMEGKMLHLQTIDEISESNPDVWEVLKQKGVNKVLICPLIYKNNVFGFIGVDNAKNSLNKSYLMDEIAKYMSLEFVRHGYYNAIQKGLTGDFMNLQHSHEILDLTKVGLWIIQYNSNNNKYKMFMDHRMLKLMGLSEELSPEEAHAHWYSRINEGYYDYIHTALSSMMNSNEVNEVEYTWNHPTQGECAVRCTGRLSDVSDGIYTIKGYHLMMKNIHRLPLLEENTASETFEYNEKKHMIYFHTNRSNIDGRKLKEDGFPQTWIKKEIIHPYFASQFEDFFDNVQNMDDSQAMDILILNKGKEYDWYHMEAHHLGDNEKDIHTCFVVLYPLINKPSLKQQYVRIDDFYKVMLSETIAHIEVDLETGYFHNGGGLWEGYVQEGKMSQQTYSSVVDKYIHMVVDDEDYEAYCEYLKIENIKERYYAGQESVQYEFKRKMPDGHSEWVQLVIHVFKEKISQGLYALLYLKNIDELKQKAISQEKAAKYDSLTNVLNRRFFKEEVETYMEKAPENQRNALLLLDLDNFKQINDEYGHLHGDQVLIQFTQVLKNTFRKSDYIGRVGGDEFAVFMKNINSQEILDNVLTRMQNALEVVENYQINCSVGIDFVEKKNYDYEKAIQHADIAMYSSKRKGKNCYCIFRQ